VKVAKDIIGNRFGKLIVIARLGSNKHKQPLWSCKCDCGNKSIVVGHKLRIGYTRSCGCLRLHALLKRSVTHGMTGTKTYTVWRSMIQRCEDMHHENYKHYGGRGIMVCERWRHSFELFLKDMGGKPPGMTIERIDNNGSYELKNCRWATQKEQCNNKRNTRRITIDGVTRTIVEGCAVLGLTYQTLYMRVRRGSNLDEAIKSI